MLSERLISLTMKLASSRYLSFDPMGEPALPPPQEGRNYMLYVHVPFCESLCTYCSFNRFPFEEGRARAYFRSLREEMRMVAALGYDFGSLYVGGGTPTVLVDELCATIDLARELFGIREVSTETNPNHLVPSMMDPLAGRVDRLSVGVQSFDDTLLKRMGRHEKYGSGEEILARVRAMEGRFRSLNVDMMFNYPTQTRAMLLRDIEMVKRAGSDQVTFYPLMASPSVAKALAGSVGRVDYAREAAYYADITRELGSSFAPATAWTFARRADAMIDEYIVDYGEYVGIGSGAFSFLDGALYVNTFSLQEYEESVACRRFAVTGMRRYSLRARMRYRLMMALFGLRLDKSTFFEDFERTPERGLPLEMAGLRILGAFDQNEGGAATLSGRGRYLLVAMMREFFAGMNEVRDQARAALPVAERDLLSGGSCRASSAGGSRIPGRVPGAPATVIPRAYGWG